MSTVQRQLDPVPFVDVTFDDGFWAPRLEKNRTVTIPHIYRQLKATGRISAFDLNFRRPVPSPVTLIFGDSDPFTWLEAASYSLAVHPDAILEATVDQLIDKIIHAQQEDGYLNTHFIVAQPEMRWRNLRDWHELYCAGHLIEGAVAYYQATGKRKLLDAVCRYADLIDTTFGEEPEKKRGYCGHPEIELALVKLYHVTKNSRYLKLATYFIDERGKQPHYFDLEARQRGEDPSQFWAKTYDYCQAQMTIRQQTKMVGHAVRAMYLLSAAADLAHENDDQSLLETCERLWDNLVTKRMYITGGIGSTRANEGFSQDYDLPDETAYAETCATIGLILWNHRLLQFSGESKYADIIERALYNGFLSGVSLDGTRFFYENPLASTGEHHRQGWFECPCCPPNIARTLASVGSYFYSTGENAVWVHLYAQGSVILKLNEHDVSLRQVTKYPWDGKVRFEIGIAQPQKFTLHLRVPGWCEGWRLGINGKPSPEIKPQANGYLAIEREWHPGDLVEYDMEMPIQIVWAHPSVRSLQGRVAIQRGPLVYCLEGMDQQGIALDRIEVEPEAFLSNKFIIEHKEDLLGGISLLSGEARIIDENGWDGKLYLNRELPTKPIEIKAIPYYAWDNRAPGEMRVWLRAKS
jgi:DUF1680 family protein